MYSKQLEQDLELPNIKASSAAYRDASQRNKWYIRFFVPGPDGRYNPAIAVVSSSRVQKLLENLKEAYEKMKVLEKKDFTGKFSEDILSRGEISNEMAATISSEVSRFLFWTQKRIRLQFLISSKTNTFTRNFDLEDVKTIINKLSITEDLATQLMRQL